VRETPAHVGNLDILIGNAGVYPNRTWTDATPSDWLDTYNRNAGSVVRIVRSFVPAMRLEAQRAPWS
jgi:NADP-dependent 3-hydroxy acid dehydrogenase YdfG